MAVIWKGAISFGLVHIPVTLKAAAREHRLSFDWLDRRDMAPVGYTRVNKTTGKEVEWKDIVKGYRIEEGREKGEYVLLSDEDFKRANPEATQTVEILSFVEAASIPQGFFETPYYLEPDKRGKKPYALLREAMKRSGRAGLARFVVHTKQHLAALLVTDNALMLNTLRFADEIQPVDDLDLPKAGAKAEGLSTREIESATKLIEDMSEDWDPGRYGDTYRDDLMARIKEKIASGQTQVLTEPDEAGAEKPRESAKIIDLVSLLKQSMGARGRGKPPARGRNGGDKDSEDARTSAKQTAAGAAAKKTPSTSARKTPNDSSSASVAKRTIGRSAPAPARKTISKRAPTARRKAA